MCQQVFRHPLDHLTECKAESLTFMENLCSNDTFGNFKVKEIYTVYSIRLSKMTTLLNLPPELLWKISEFLTPSAQTAFKLTCHRVYVSTPNLDLNKSVVDNCTYQTINGFLEFNKDRRRCMLCKKWYPNSLFSDDSPKPNSEDERQQMDFVLRHGVDSLGGSGMIDNPPGCCGWHKGSLHRVINASDENFVKAFTSISAARTFSCSYKWTSKMEIICFHCGKVKAWTKCNCDCESCGESIVRTYTRLVRHQSDLGKFVFFRKDGDTWVREWRRETLDDTDIVRAGKGRLCVDVRVESLD
jgi:hypothetical protein